jgi:hypothetical protein
VQAALSQKALVALEVGHAWVHHEEEQPELVAGGREAGIPLWALEDLHCHLAQRCYEPLQGQAILGAARLPEQRKMRVALGREGEREGGQEEKRGGAEMALVSMQAGWQAAAAELKRRPHLSSSSTLR